jgi:predicted  nucleic acid-binding Zn-ribbon protein
MTERTTDDLERLLAVQEVDTNADVLRHRRDHLPERAELATRQDELAALEAASAPLRERRHEIARAQQQLEDQIALLAEKTDTVNATMYGGSMSNAKELQSLQSELDSLARRRASLEDQILQQMVEAEPVDAELATVATKREVLDARAVDVTAVLVEAETSIDAELEALEAQRATLVDGLDPALVERYEKLRARLKGVGVARFVGGTCHGCHLALPAAEAEQVRREARDEGVATCPECDRLLVV